MRFFFPLWVTLLLPAFAQAGGSDPCQAAEQLRGNPSVMRYFHFQVGRLGEICQSGQKQWKEWMMSHQLSLVRLGQLDAEFQQKRATAQTAKNLSIADMARNNAELAQVGSQMERERDQALQNIRQAQAAGETLLSGITNLKIHGVCSEMGYVPAAARAECSQAANAVDEFARANKDFLRETLLAGFSGSQTNQQKASLEQKYGGRLAGFAAAERYAGSAAASALGQTENMTSLTGNATGTPDQAAPGSPVPDTASSISSTAPREAAPMPSRPESAQTETGTSTGSATQGTSQQGTGQQGFGAEVLQSISGMGAEEGEEGGGSAPTGACRKPTGDVIDPLKAPDEAACKKAGGEWIPPAIK
ncbi:MAG: hypothetical protein HUU37_02510 [Bdellovibrionales bacterium]|nr:hypothetical protein [Bdellovibrionales bacterium]